MIRADLPSDIAYPDVLLDGGESTSGWSGTQLDTTDLKYGAASLRRTSTSPRFFKAFATPVNASNRRFLTFWYYIDDPSKVVDTDQQVEIGSAGTYDQQERSWNITGLRLHRGWNYVVLNIATAMHRTATDGVQADLSRINWFRIYQKPNASVTTRIDQILFTNRPQISLAYSQFWDQYESILRHPDGNGLTESAVLGTILRLPVTDANRKRECRIMQLLRQRRSVSQVHLNALGVTVNGWNALRTLESYTCGETTIPGATFDQTLRAASKDYVAEQVNLVKDLATRLNVSTEDAAETLWRLYAYNDVRIYDSCGTVESEVTAFIQSGTNPAGIVGPNALFRNCSVSSQLNLPQEIATRVGGGRSLTTAGDKYRACVQAFASQASDCSNPYAMDPLDLYIKRIDYLPKFQDREALEYERGRMLFDLEQLDSFDLSESNNEIRLYEQDRNYSTLPAVPEVQQTLWHIDHARADDLDRLHKEYDDYRGRESVARTREEHALKNMEVAPSKEKDFIQQSRHKAELYHDKEGEYYLKAEETRKEICEIDEYDPLCEHGEPPDELPLEPGGHPKPTEPTGPVARCSEMSVDGHAAWYETSAGSGVSRELNAADRMNHCLCEVFDRRYADLPQFQLMTGEAVSRFCPGPEDRVKHECTQPGWEDGPPSKECLFGLVSDEYTGDELKTRLCWAMRSTLCPDPRITANGDCSCYALQSGGTIPTRKCSQVVNCVDGIPDDSGCGCRKFDMPRICSGNVLATTRPILNTFDGISALAGRPALSVGNVSPIVTRALTRSSLINGNRFSFKLYNPDNGGAMTGTADVRCTNLRTGVNNYLVDRIALSNLGSGVATSVNAAFTATDLDSCFGAQRTDSSHVEVLIKASRPAPSLAFVSDLDLSNILDPIQPALPCVEFPPRGPTPRPSPTWNLSTGQVIRSDLTLPYPKLMLDGVVRLPATVEDPVHFVQNYGASPLALMDRGTTPTTSQVAVTRSAAVNKIGLQINLRGNSSAGRYNLQLVAPNGTVVHDTRLQADGEAFDGGILVTPSTSLQSNGTWTLRVRDAGGTNNNTKSGDLYSWSLNFNPVEAFDPPAEGSFPPGWSCNGRDGFEDTLGEFYGDGDCDCGCGVIDIDCTVHSISECEYEYCSGGRTVNPENIAQCN